MNKNEENNKKKPNENNPFSLPDGYFGSFSKKMMLKIELAQELKEFKILSSIDKTLPFVTPDNYFTGSEVGSELAAYTKLSAVKKQNGFATPEFYFETSAEAIKTKIEIVEELKAYPSLYSITKENSFVAPQNYFEGLSHSVREKIVVAKTEENGFGRIIQLVFSKQTAYAIAATLVISLGLYFYNSGEETVVGNCGTLACIDKSEIFKGNQLLNLDEDALMEIVNIEKLSKNLKDNLKQSAKENDNQTKEDYAIENIDVNDIIDEI
jgi:hypothetical protein